jgi:pimeloyl-ACP methyl ester carboxylesterase
LPGEIALRVGDLPEGRARRPKEELMNASCRMRRAFAAIFVLMGLWICLPLSAIASQAEPDSPQFPTTSGNVQANGIAIAYESFGTADRETILLIAGTGMQLVDWPFELVAELVHHGYRVVRFDNRDVGRSTTLTEAGLPDSEAIIRALEAGEPAPLPYSLHDLARDAIGVLDALDIHQAHIVGMSMGGAIAQLIAIDHPDRTLSLTSLMADSGNVALPVVANPEAFTDVPAQPTTADRDAFIAWQVKTWQAMAGAGYPTDEATLRARAERNFARGYDPAGLLRHQTASLMGHIESPSYRLNHLEAIEAPTVVLQGTEDPIVPIASAEDLVARVPEAELRIVPGLGHDIPMALVPVFADAILTAAMRAHDAA